MTVRIVESDRDFWFDIAEADGNLEADEEPCLSEDGLSDYVCFRERMGTGPARAFEHTGRHDLQHVTRDRDEAIARALGGLMNQVQSDHAEKANEGT